ncbi:hypothetical protein [Clostridium sp. FS41]|uniref:hypothetical protein n=1 Tax=Clostridium sp. FS41 TaxID=1609975 RepID=UPI0005D345ED|nr:hypothetical protein [Clostridium sp. FS41]KJJ71702.1 hypothetical protein CLFS41_23640 [Clostridium sp. FS41]
MNLDTYRCITDQELAEIMVGMDQAERSGMFDGLFSKEQPGPTLEGASKEQLLQSISPIMNLTKSFFKRVYGYELTWPGFADQALIVLKGAGCSRAREYYDSIVQKYESQYVAGMKSTLKWYCEKCEKEWRDREKGSEEQRLRKMSNQELLELLKNSAAGA